MEFKIIENEQTPFIQLMSDDNVKLFLEKNNENLQSFLEFVKNQENAIGLAANQTSLNGNRFMLRAFAIKDLKTNQWKLIINPEIIEYVGIKELKSEGCLTWKNKKIIAERYRAIKTKYFNEKGEKFTNELHVGLNADIWQHEINHLNGVKEYVVDLNYPEPKQLKIGRNEICLCGSEKKYKKCCNNYI